MGHEILLMDEPTAGLDPMGEHKMMELLTRLNRESGVTMVMATHSVDLAPLFLSRLHILSRGRVVRSGTPEEVFNAGDDLGQVKLRLPYIAELIRQMKTGDQMPFKRLPLTIGEARREIVELFGMQKQ
jgi:cobalt/nickel transport system ATP-binding protein